MEEKSGERNGEKSEEFGERRSCYNILVEWQQTIGKIMAIFPYVDKRSIQFENSDFKFGWPASIIAALIISQIYSCTIMPIDEMVADKIATVKVACIFLYIAMMSTTSTTQFTTFSRVKNLRKLMRKVYLFDGIDFSFAGERIDYVMNSTEPTDSLPVIQQPTESWSEPTDSLLVTKILTERWIRANVSFNEIPEVPSTFSLTFKLVMRNIFGISVGAFGVLLTLRKLEISKGVLCLLSMNGLQSCYASCYYSIMLSNIITLLRCKVIEANKCLKHVLHTSDTIKLIEFRKFHSKLREIVSDCNGFFGLPILGFFSMFTVYFCQVLTLIVIYYLDFRPGWTIATGFFSLFCVSGIFLAISNEVEELDNQADDLRKQMTEDKFHFNCMNLFNLNRRDSVLQVMMFILMLAVVEVQAAVGDFTSSAE